MLEIQPKFQTCDKQKNRENKTPKVKQSHTQDSIYVIWQFAYVHRVAGISLLSKKITMCSSSIEVLTFVSTATGVLISELLTSFFLKNASIVFVCS